MSDIDEDEKSRLFWLRKRSAFPVNDPYHEIDSRGISRLDYFAAAALTGILATDNYREADAARIALECAEALIKEIDNG